MSSLSLGNYGAKMLCTIYVHFQPPVQRLSFLICLRCRSKSNQSVCVFIVCPLSVHTVFSVLVHPALVQIHFSWSVSFIQDSLSLFLSSLVARTKDVLPWFHAWCDALQSARSTNSSISVREVFLFIFSRYHFPTPLAFSRMFSGALLLLIAVL